MKKKLLMGIGIFFIICLILGVKMHMDAKKFNEEMIKIVYSEEAQQVFKQGLRNLDPKAFTKDGVIKSYKVDKESIEHNPMGGIEVTLIINNDSKLNINYTLDKYDGKLVGGAAIMTEELAKMVGKWEEVGESDAQ